MPDCPDQKIIAKAVSGDVMAFRTLVETNQAFVYRVAYRMVGTVGDAEDITQEAFIRLWKNLHRYKREVRLTTWLYRIVTNLCLDLLKSRQNRGTRNTVDLDSSLCIRMEMTADQGLIDEELRLTVERLSEKLSPRQKAVFILRDLEEISMPEIAKILSMDAGQVKSNLYYARKKIAEMISIHYQSKKH